MTDEPSVSSVSSLPALETVAAPNAEITLLSIISRAATDPNTDIEKLTRLMDLYERMKASESERAFIKALTEMQPELPITDEKGAIKGKDGKVQSKYAKWEDIQEVIKPILAKYGFALTFSVANRPGEIVVTAKLSHDEGHVEETTMALPIDTSGAKNIVQAHGSSTSYGMRYTARALLNLTSRGSDDDGQAGGTKLISEGQAEALTLLVKNAKADLPKFLEHFKITAIDQLPLHQLPVAEQMLQDRLKRGPKKLKAAPKEKPGELMDLETQMDEGAREPGQDG